MSYFYPMIQQKDLINWANLSRLLTGRPDNLRRDRISETNKTKVKELEELITYWLSKYQPKHNKK